MFLKILINKILGYVRINIEGFYIERFINICKSKRILLWGIKRENTSILHANISIKDFKEVKEISRKTKCRIHIERKRGIPFFFNKYKKRKIFMLGFLIIITIILGTSNFIWNIEIIGNEKIGDDELVQQLKDEGLEIGKFKSKINKKEIINSIRLKRNDISWIGIEIKGTNAVVKVVEADEKPKVINDNEYCNIVSDKEGIIEKISSTKGTSVVKEGDLIKKGDILIAGWMEGKYTGIRYVHASGEIQAKTWYSCTERVDLKTTTQKQTGNQETKYQIKFNNFQINLYKTLSKFEKYDTMYTDKKIKIFSDFYLPVEITRCNNFEIIEEEKNFSKEEAKNLAIQNAEEKLDNEVNSTENIQNKNINVNENEEYVEVEVIYEVLENIGTEEKIVF